MSIWKPLSVDQEPISVVDLWAVYEVEFEDFDKKSRHIVGFVNLMLEGRVSSPIVSFDKETRTATTRSGRKYKLGKESYLNMGMHSDTSYVWDNWKNINKVKNFEDISREY